MSSVRARGVPEPTLPAARVTAPDGGSGAQLAFIRFRPIASFLRSELDFLYALQKIRRVLPLSVRWLCDRLLSSHPFFDVTIGLWMAVPWLLFAYGWVLFWLLSANLFLTFALHWATEAPSPGDVDSRLRPRGRVSPSGFPCMEIQLAACILAYIAWWHATLRVTGLCVGAGGFLVLLRFYALTHFPHQIK